MKMTRFRLGPAGMAAALAAGLTVGLSGCGSKETPSNEAPVAPSGPSGAAPAAPATTQASEKVDLGLAAGKPFIASSALPPYSGSGTIASLAADVPFFFHTKEEEGPWVQIDLGTVTKVSHVDVGNRRDCCGERAVPLVLELSTDGQTWTEAARTDEKFDVWSPTLTAKDTRFVRLRVPRKTYFHLRRVGIR